MYTELYVRNFRGLNEFEVRELSPVVLISGQNSTGKSSVLEALFLNACGPLAAQYGVTTLRAFRGDSGLALDATGESTPWDSLYSNFDTDRSILIEAVQDRERLVVDISPDPDSVAPLGPLPPGQSGTQTITASSKVRFARGKSMIAKEYVQSLRATINANQGNIAGFNLEASISPSDAQAPVVAHLKGARTRATQQELAERYSKLKIRGRESDLLRVLKVIDPRLRRVEILLEQGQPALFLDLGRRVPLPLTVLGEGIASIVDFVTSISFASGGVVLIDEIENGIHHSVLPALWSLIHRAAERANVQVIATTHSHECVEAAYSALAKRPDQLSLLRLRRKDDRVVATPYDVEMLSGALENNLELR